MLGFFKKKKAEPEKEPTVKVTTTTFKSVVNDTPPEYNPWDSSEGNADNEYANTVFINMHSQPTPLRENPDDYPRYVSYDLGISNPVEKFNDLLETGYLEKANVADVLATYTMAELKEILTANNLSTTGRKKADLLERILSSLNIEELDLPAMYIMSAKGKEYVEQNQDMLKLFRNPYNISYEEFSAAKAARPAYLKFNDIIWAVFNEREKEIPLHHNGGRRNNARHRAHFLKNENKLAGSLSQYITVLYFDISDYIIRELRHAEFLSKVGDDDDDECPPFYLVPEVKDALVELKEYFTDDMITDALNHHIDPRPVASENTFRQMVLAIMDGKEIEVSIN